MQSVYQLTTKPEKGSSYSVHLLQRRKATEETKEVKGWLRKQWKEANDEGENEERRESNKKPIEDREEKTAKRSAVKR